jgi:23S rRNA pseudouridine2605 synthase
MPTRNFTTHHRPPRHGLARVLSKLGLCSRTQGAHWVQRGRVAVNGRVVRDPEFPVCYGQDAITVDGNTTTSARRRVIMLNKPRGLITSTADEKGRDTVYRCLDGSGLPWLAPVGRLDKASEGLLLFSNDPLWSARITAPDSAVDKTYHVQIDRLADERLLADLETGVDADGGRLAAKRARCLRRGEKHSWLQIVLDEGRNRQIRRLLAAREVSVLRLLRVAIGSLTLGELGKGRWRELSEAEIEALQRREP